jgi:hypothetical protein
MEDFKEAKDPETLQKLFQTLNPTLNDTASAMDRRLALRSNLATAVKTVTVTAPDWIPVNSETSGVRPYFGTNWSNYTGADFNEPAQYWVEDSGRVAWAGMVANSGAPSAGDVLVYLPANVSLDLGKPFPAVTDTGAGAVDARNDQTLTYRSGGSTWLSLNAISYHVDVLPAFSGAGWPLIVKPVGDDGRALGGPPVWAALGRAEDLDAQTNTAHVAGGLDWATDARGNAIIKRVGGLRPGRRYRLTFVLWG